MNIVNITIILSIIIQLITGIVGLDGFRYKLNPKDLILKDILSLETGVQFLELLFYILFALINIPLDSLAGIRYYDWLFTTPTMLISSMMYFAYINNEETKKEILTTKSFFQKNIKSIILVVIFNTLMLAVGFMGEIKLVSMLFGLISGFIFFAISFYEMYKNNIKSLSSKSFPMFSILTIIWSIYGIIFPFNPVIKNTLFNILDLVSKNFYG